MFVLLSHTEIDMHACSHVSHTLCLWVFSYVFTHTARIIVDYYTYLSRKAETQAGRRIVLDLGLHTHTKCQVQYRKSVGFFYLLPTCTLTCVRPGRAWRPDGQLRPAAAGNKWEEREGL